MVIKHRENLGFAFGSVCANGWVCKSRQMVFIREKLGVFTNKKRRFILRSLSIGGSLCRLIDLSSVLLLHERSMNVLRFTESVQKHFIFYHLLMTDYNF